jgi:hypothetical protein
MNTPPPTPSWFATRTSWLVKRVNRQPLRASLLLAGLLSMTVAVVMGILAPAATTAVVLWAAVAIVLHMLALSGLARPPAGRLSAEALESALGEMLRAIKALEGRSERLEKLVTLTRVSARSGKDVPAWIELARRIPLDTTVLVPALDPRALIALIDRATSLESGATIMILADDQVGPVVAHSLLVARPDLRPVVLMSSEYGDEGLRQISPALDIRSRAAKTRSFDAIAGPWYVLDEMDDFRDVRLVFVAGPSLRFGAPARHAVLAGLMELTSQVTLVINRPEETPVARAVALWARTAPSVLQWSSPNPWEVDVTISEA